MDLTPDPTLSTAWQANRHSILLSLPLSDYGIEPTVPVSQGGKLY